MGQAIVVCGRIRFRTEYISQLRVRQSNPTSQNTCFTVYDTSGTIYEFGCTTDSVRFTTSGTTHQNYEWDLDRIVAPGQGASTAYKIIKISYLQDCNASPCTNVRDAGIKQITYGYSTSGNTSTGDHQNTPGNSDYTNSCNGNYSSIYSPCEVMVLWDRSNLAEGQDGSGPLLEHDYTYDDYTSAGLTSGYHNLTQEVTQPSNNLNVTQKWYYKPHDTTVSGIVYYDVNKPFESEVDDPASGHRYACTYTLYDESPAGAGGITPNAGWPTTIKTYSNSTCGSDPSQGAPASSVRRLTTSYLGYDAYGNAVTNVDAVGAANSSLYSSNGCSLTTAPVWMTSTANWAGSQKFTACTTYDSFNAQPATTKNALNLSTSISYDSTQGRLPTQVTDANGQNTATSYSYDSGSATTSQYLYCDSAHLHQLTGLYATGATCSNKTGQAYASSYDIWGNVTQRIYGGVTATLSYDTLDHFTQWNGGNTNQEWYVYDAVGNRVLKRTTGTGRTVLTSYHTHQPENNRFYKRQASHKRD